MKKYFLFMGKKFPLSNFYDGQDGESGKYYININLEDLKMPHCEVMYEEFIKGDVYEYTLGRYDSGIWETRLSFISKDRLIIEE